MPSKAPKNQKRRRTKRLKFEPDPAPVLPEPRLVPRWWLNTVIGLFLLVPAWVLTETFFTSFSQVMQQEFWLTEEFWFFSLGCLLWMLWFSASFWIFGEPRFIRLYVFGHELTHAIWVWLCGGMVNKFEYGRDGGYILTDKDNFIISLSPYFYPIYSAAIILVYGIASIFYDLTAASVQFAGVTPIQALFLILGITWAFHLSFTCWMIPKGQTDLTRHGTFFSLVVIYSMNIVVLTVFLIVAAPEITTMSFARELLANTEDTSALLWRLFIQPLLPANSL